MATTRLIAGTPRAGWYLDSGANIHITNDRRGFNTFRTCELTVNSVDGTKLKAQGIGSVSIYPECGGRVTLTNVYYAPNSQFNLISAGIPTNKGCTILLRRDDYLIRDKDGDIVCSGKRDGNNYLITQRSDKSATAKYTKTASKPASWDDWHRRLGHARIATVSQAAKLTTGINPEKATYNKTPNEQEQSGWLIPDFSDTVGKYLGTAVTAVRLNH